MSTTSQYGPESAEVKARQLSAHYGQGSDRAALEQHSTGRAAAAEPTPPEPTNAEMLDQIASSIATVVSTAAAEAATQAATPPTGPVDLDELAGSDAFKAWKERMQS